VKAAQGIKIVAADLELGLRFVAVTDSLLTLE